MAKLTGLDFHEILTKTRTYLSLELNVECFVNF